MWPAVHSYGGVRTVNGAAGEQRVDAAAGTPVRVRVVNTDNGPLVISVGGTAFRVMAIDARDVNRPTPVTGRSLTLPAGGRADLGFTTPTDGSAVRVRLGPDGRADLIVGPAGSPAPERTEPSGEVDLLSYGSPAALGFDPDAIDRRFTYSIGRRPGFVDGVPGMHWSVNGHLYPDLPMYMVGEGDVVRFTLDNHSGMLHPMHLHGHHAVVLSRNGVPATGSPWWIDTIDVDDGDTYEIALVADNPGIWMYHCHNLDHAADGFVLHMGYIGVHTPYLIGGPAGNQPDFRPRL